MDLLLIRHAQPDWAPNGIARNDPELTDLGRSQAEKLGHLAEEWEEVREILVSPMVRARQTAEPLGNALGIEATVEPWLAEIADPDSWEGSPVDEVDRMLERIRLGRSMRCGTGSPSAGRPSGTSTGGSPVAWSAHSPSEG